jgi:hypothetical protein
MAVRESFVQTWEEEFHFTLRIFNGRFHIIYALQSM